MAYSELVKSFERIRNYMREFYVYGFKSRDEYGMKSARSYDNERRRIESWLGDYMSFHQESSGKKVFLSMDSRRVPCNPLYKAFKAKSFTDKDITLHFYIMDLLADGSALSSKEIVDRINDDYLSHFNGDFSLDESTVRKKLKEYEDIGLLQSEKIGREVIYRRSGALYLQLAQWARLPTNCLPAKDLQQHAIRQAISPRLPLPWQAPDILPLGRDQESHSRKR